MKFIDVPPDLLRACHAEGARTYPEEACGVLSGPEDGDGLTEFHPMENIINQMHAEDPERYPRTAARAYYMDPAEMMRLDKSLKKEGRRIKVIFHSHVDVGAYFSEEDITRALWAGEPIWPGVGYLVCNIKNGEGEAAIMAQFDEEKRTFVSAPVGE